jgi:hypothetical protein
MADQSPSTPRFQELYWSTIARVLGWFAVILAAGSAYGAIVGRARTGNILGTLIFGSAAFLLLWAARRIRAAAYAAPSTSIVGQLVVLIATCFFVAGVTYRWLMNEFPTSKFVLLMVFGMCVVGALAGFAVSALANIAFRAGPPKLRVPFTAIVWLAVCAGITEWLLNNGADQTRTWIVTGIASVSGLVVGTLNAELIVGRWYLERHARLPPSGSKPISHLSTKEA